MLTSEKSEFCRMSWAMSAKPQHAQHKTATPITIYRTVLFFFSCPDGVFVSSVISSPVRFLY